jgi:hypothetical protein
MVEFRSFIVVKQSAKLSASSSNPASVSATSAIGSGTLSTPDRRTPTKGLSTKQVGFANMIGGGGNGYLTYELS